MENFFTELTSNLSTSMSNYSLRDLAIVICGSLALAIWVGRLYRKTHTGDNYDQGYAQTLILMGGIIAMIMLIVGSDMAKAFTMMGAFSIVRFRNKIKETRDVGFIFLVMAIGMAMGTKLYALAAIATAVMSAVIYIMYRFDWFALNAAHLIKTKKDKKADLE